MKRGSIVLYAEDDPRDVELMQRAFTKAGLADRLKIVTDGKEAIVYLAGNGKVADRREFPWPVLLLVDLKMPRKTGFDVIRWVRQSPQFVTLPTVVLTASDADPDIKRAYRLGANSYLVKPTTLEKITALAKNLDRYWLTLNRVMQRGD
jgi:CheY-like chemotaxis protein